MNCPKCGAHVPPSDYICAECGSYVPREEAVPESAVEVAPQPAPTPTPRVVADSYPPLHGWPGLGRFDGAAGSNSSTEAQSADEPAANAPPNLGEILEEERRVRGRRMAFWSIGCAALAFLLPAIFGPIGVVTGYFAFRLGETRLGVLAVSLSAVAMLFGIAAGLLTAA